MKRGILIGCLILILVIAVALPVMARGPKAKRGIGPIGPKGFGHHHGPFWRDAKMIEELQLNDDQVAALKETDYAFHERAIELRASVEKTELEMQRAMDAETINEGAVKKTAKKLADLQGQMLLLKVDHNLAVQKVLTDEQRKKMKTQPAFGSKHKMRKMRRAIYMDLPDAESTEE